MDDAFCFRALYAVCVNMGHDVMTNLFLTGFCHIVVNILCMCFQLINLLLGNGQSQLFLGLCQCNPQFSPGLEFHVLRENILHFLAGITL